MPRIDGRANHELRPVRIAVGCQAYAEGSALIEMGNTKVLCTVSLEEKVPPFLRNSDTGWVTAEYAMLPRSTKTRTPREAAQGRVSGRSQEIQRLIGRSLRVISDLRLLDERTLIVDCDVLQADGGTRTAAITGAYVALAQAAHWLLQRQITHFNLLKDAVAACSVGVVDGEELLDLCYEEDCHAEADFNVVMTGDGRIVEVQGTAEARPFSRSTLDSVINLAERGLRQLLEAQRAALKAADLSLPKLFI